MSKRTSTNPVEDPRETTIVPCFVCGKWLDRVDDEPMQPSLGVICDTLGNYGSRVLDGERVRFIVCDECLTERTARTRQVNVKRIRSETTYTTWPGGDVL